MLNVPAMVNAQRVRVQRGQRASASKNNGPAFSLRGLRRRALFFAVGALLRLSSSLCEDWPQTGSITGQAAQKPE